MITGSYRISVEKLENGFKVEVPDLAAIAKKEAERKKAGDKYPVYVGDCTKSFAAKSTAEVLKLVKQAIMQIPEAEYDSAFDEATKSDD